ncbi:MAG: VIT domain-containing protein [Nannocystales bacterium]
MKAYARVAGVLSMIAAGGFAGCAQHASPMDLDVEPVDEQPQFTRHAQAEELGPHRLPQRCALNHAPAAAPIGPDEGWDRSAIRVQTAEGLRELPLQESSFETLVLGTVAETTVTQVFANPFSEPIEAVYAFPLHERAAVDDYWIHIGDRSLHGEIHRRADAKQIYEEAKANGQRAGLLEQERPNVFTQSLANILPGESIEVQMHVVQPVALEAGRGTLSLPTVVGPRFIPGTPTGHSGVGTLPDTDEVPDASKITPPVLDPKSRGCAPVVITVDIESTHSIGGLSSANHSISSNTGNGVTTVELSAGATVANRDFELSWMLGGETTEAGLMTQPEDGGGGAFTLTLVPPTSLDADEAVPRDLIFVVDNSGSMGGKPMDTAKAVMREAIRSMGPDDRFSVLRFSESASKLSPGLLNNTAGNRRKGLDYVDGMRGMGGTHMRAGIEAALALAQSSDRVPMVLLLTDGYIGNEAAIFELADEHLGHARIFGLGVGQAPNRFLLGGLSTVGRGAVSYVGASESVEQVVDRFYRRIASPALRDISIDWGTLPVEDVAPQRIPDLFVGQPVVVFGRYASEGSGTVVVEGWQGGRKARFEVEVDLAKGSSGTGLRSMWARTRIEELLRDPEVFRLDSAARDRRTEAATEIALAYRVLTEHTAFVAVDKDVATKDPAKTVAVQVEPVSGMAARQSGSLGLVGAGRGGGGVGQGTIGLGNTGLVGKGAGGGSGSGYGRGTGAGFGGRGKRVPRVRHAKAQVTGSLDGNVIRRVVRAHNNTLRACYEPVLKADPNASFKVTIGFTIDSEGRVKASLTWSTEPASDAEKAFGACLETALERIRFPKPAGGGTVTVRYPLVFAPG